MKIRNLRKQGLSITEISQQVVCDRKTTRKYLSCDVVPKYERSNKSSILDPYKDFINSKLDKYNLTSKKLFEEIQKQGYKGKYGIVNKFVKSIKKEKRQNAFIRFETLPGEQAQVDWGFFGNFFDKEKKRWIKLNCLFIILGYSRTLYIEFFDNARLQNFLIGHNNAFKYFGGYTKEILYDNLKSVVIKRALSVNDSEFNQGFMDFAGYYGFKPILARPYKPTTKGKVENSVNYVRKNFFAGEEFFSLKDLNSRALIWLNKINNRNHATTHEKPFDRLKKENLIPMIGNRIFDTSIKYHRKVFKDCHFSFESNKYSVPFAFAGKEITVKIGSNECINVYYRDALIASHNLLKEPLGKYITSEEHIKELRKLNMSFTKPAVKKKSVIEKSKILLLNRSVAIEQLEKIDLKKYDEVIQ